MTAHDWYIDNRVAYATRGLAPDEERAFDEHLSHCPECTGAIDRIRAELAWLPMGVPPVPPPPGFSRRVLNAVLDGGPARRRTWSLPAAAAAALVAATVTWAVGARRAERLEAALATANSRTMALGDTLSVMRSAGRVAHVDIHAGEAKGTFVLFDDPTTHRWNVVVSGLPPAPAGETYQFWFICEDGMVRGTQVEPRRGGALFVTGMPGRGGRVLGAALSREPMQAPGDAPQGPMLVHLML